MGIHRNRAWSFYHLAQHQEAVTAAEQALSLDQDDPLKHEVRGYALAALDQWERAAAALETAFRSGHGERWDLYRKALRAQGYLDADREEFQPKELAAALLSCLKANCRLEQ